MTGASPPPPTGGPAGPQGLCAPEWKTVLDWAKRIAAAVFGGGLYVATGYAATYLRVPVAIIEDSFLALLLVPVVVGLAAAFWITAADPARRPALRKQWVIGGLVLFATAMLIFLFFPSSPSVVISEAFNTAALLAMMLGLETSLAIFAVVAISLICGDNP